jgi:hypothetical protein
MEALFPLQAILLGLPPPVPSVPDRKAATKENGLPG